ncbi:ABC transporter permease [Pseudonocardia sp. TRM90224]|uniref:ABC transporter permease n=1 Tax=Pseudonocardia sp. TRM90224 TaxID=2812678 RepID=UPI001E36040F|nr:ABC transporter permease [Pseudonocardia sp. TRM90224]
MTAIAISAPAARRHRDGLLVRAVRVRRTRIGLALTLLVLATAFLGPLVAPHGVDDFVGGPYLAESPGTVFGTDNLGRDVLTRFLHGGQLLLVLSLLATLIGVGIGAAVGVTAGYRRGWVDETLMRTGDVLLAFPQVVVALLFLSILGPQLWLIVLIVGLSHAPRVARVIRGATLGVAERDFVKAAEAAAVPRWRIAFSEILPNVTGALMVELGLRLTYSIGLIAALSFLGLGLQPPTADWGLMINENRVALTVSPWAVVLPVTAIAVLTIGTNLITDGLSRASAGIDRGVTR